MPFQAVTVYNLDGDFLGYSIKDLEALKLHTANLWTEDDVSDLQAQLARLNQAVDIRQYWPDVRDPEVQELVNNPSWEPLRLSKVEVVDEEASNFVWIEEPSDENPYGKMDEDASDLAFKLVDIPAPADVQARIKKACEIVARERAGLNG